MNAFLCKRKGGLNIVRNQVSKRPLSSDVTGVENERHRRSERKIETLHPAKMISKVQGTYDISEATRLRFSVPDETHPTTVHLHKVKGRPPFPANTRGVLYYHRDPAMPPVAGGVRFRLCDTVENFERGSDLHILGVPWSLTLTRIAYTPNFIPLRELLVKEGLVDRQMMSDISKIPNLDKLDDRLALYDLFQPFHVDLTTTALTLNLVTRNAVQGIRFPNLFTDRRENRCLSLYSGTMKARFELSDLPEHRASGPTLVLRFLDNITGIEPLHPHYKGLLLRPMPGCLLQRRARLYLQPKPWYYPLKKRRYGAVLKDFIGTTDNSEN